MTPARRTLGLAAVAAAIGILIPASPSPLDPVQPPTVTARFEPVADAYVDAARPDANFGGASTLVAGGAPERTAVLRFDVSGLTGTVTYARLRLHVADTADGGSTDGGTVTALAGGRWAESEITHAEAPLPVVVPEGEPLDRVGIAPRNSWREVDVSPAVTGDGVVTFVISSLASDEVHYDTRQAGTTAPELVVATGPTPDDPVLVGVGDIASCLSAGHAATANLLDAIPGTVFTTGDNAYPNGTIDDFDRCYDPQWGRHKWRTRPATGNHEYYTDGASGYFEYFGDAAGDPDAGYYSYDLGEWHIAVLNSNCRRIDCAAGSEQERWLRADLAASDQRCTLAYWHHPMFTSGSSHAPSTAMKPMFEVLYDHGADVVVAGHAHSYERFGPQNPDGELDQTRGIRTFVAGMGGANHHKFGHTAPNSEVRNGDTYGVLAFTLRDGSYDWRFVPVEGGTFTDTGSGTC